MRHPTKHQAMFLSAVSRRGMERQQGRMVDGYTWGTQAAAEKEGWVTTRPGNVNVWERWYVITPEGEAAIARHRAAKVTT